MSKTTNKSKLSNKTAPVESGAAEPFLTDIKIEGLKSN